MKNTIPGRGLICDVLGEGDGFTSTLNQVFSKDIKTVARSDIFLYT